MKKVRILFYKAKIDGKILDNAIAFWSGLWNWGTKPYSHVELEFCNADSFSPLDGRPVKGVCFSSATRGKFTGVRFAPSWEILTHRNRWDYIEMTIADDVEQIMFDEAKRLVGAKYDYLALFGFCLPYKIQDSDKWYCSEAVNQVLYAGGRLSKLYRWSPRVTSRLLSQMYGQPKELRQW